MPSKRSDTGLVSRISSISLDSLKSLRSNGDSSDRHPIYNIAIKPSDMASFPFIRSEDNTSLANDPLDPRQDTLNPDKRQLIEQMVLRVDNNYTINNEGEKEENDENEEMEEEEEDVEEIVKNESSLTRAVSSQFIIQPLTNVACPQMIEKQEGLSAVEDAKYEKGKAAEAKKRPLKKRKKKRALSLVDQIISVMIVGPLVIGCWRGAWVLMDIYPEMFPAWFCFIVGTGLHTTFAIFKEQLHGNCVKALNKRNNLSNQILYRTCQILYTLTFGLSCIAQWRGGWILLDAHLINAACWAIGCFTCILIIVLMFLRCVRNLVAPPFLILIDNVNYVYLFPTRYKKVGKTSETRNIKRTSNSPRHAPSPTGEKPLMTKEPESDGA